MSTTAYYIWGSGDTFFSPVTNAQTSTYQLDPCPLINYAINWERDENGDRVVETRDYTLTGFILANKGVNVASGALTGLENVTRQQDLMVNAFGKDRQQFIVFDENGFIVFNEQPNAVSLDFSEGIWFNHIPYTLQLQAEEGVSASGNVKDASETWNISQNEDESVTISHSVSANGIATDTEDAFTNAKSFVLSKVGQNPLIQSFFVSLSGKSAHNHSKQETSERSNGNYSIEETWLAHSLNFLDDRTVTVTYERNAVGDLVVSSSGINGTISGFSSTDDPSPSGRFAAALDGFEDVVQFQIGWNDLTLLESREQVNSLLAGTVGYSLVRSASGNGSEFEEKSRTVSLSRNENGSTTETVTASAKIKQSSLLTYSDAETFVLANVFAEDSTSPPFTAASGLITSRGKEKDVFNKSASMTVAYLDSGSADYLEEYSVEVTTELSKVTGRISGTVQGLAEEPTTSSTIRFTKALNAWEGTVKGLRFPRVQAAASGTVFNTKELNNTFGENRRNGSINYSTTYDDRESLASGVVDENVSINYSGGDDIFVLIPIPGLLDGPIAQDMQAIDPVVINASINMIFESGVSPSLRRTIVCEKMQDLFGGLLPAGTPLKQTLAEDTKARALTLVLNATLVGSAIDLSWRCN